MASLGNYRVKEGSHSGTGLRLLRAGLKVCTSSPPRTRLALLERCWETSVLASFFGSWASILLMPMLY